MRRRVERARPASRADIFVLSPGEVHRHHPSRERASTRSARARVHVEGVEIARVDADDGRAPASSARGSSVFVDHFDERLDAEPPSAASTSSRKRSLGDAAHDEEQRHRRRWPTRARSARDR